jgi:hypothetical protein
LLGGLFVLKILVSCKRKTARLSQQDIDAFAGELRASGAQKGLLFSHEENGAPSVEPEAAALLGQDIFAAGSKKDDLECNS